MLRNHLGVTFAVLWRLWRWSGCGDTSTTIWASLPTRQLTVGLFEGNWINLPPWKTSKKLIICKYQPNFQASWIKRLIIMELAPYSAVTTAWYGGQQERILDYNPTRYVFPLISSLYAANQKNDGGQERKRHANSPTHSAALRNCHFHAAVTPNISTRSAHHMFGLACAILMPKFPPSSAFVQHFTCFAGLVPFSCRSSPLL